MAWRGERIEIENISCMNKMNRSVEQAAQNDAR